MKIYLSYSLAEKDKSILDKIVGLSSDFGVTVVPAPRSWPSQDAVPPEVAEAIDSADFALFWLTVDGPALSCINLEAGYIRNSPRRLPFMIFSPNGFEPSGCLQYRPFVRFNIRDTRITIGQIWDFLHHEYCDQPQAAAAFGGVLLALVGMLLMRHAPEVPPPTDDEKYHEQLRQAAVLLRGGQS
ncbi:MAG TPA: hypothetical protein VNK24_02920 [Elusimicrobiota bacterium]|nr:hypothetical protein [Elusimicrobiota bacterium]